MRHGLRKRIAFYYMAATGLLLVIVLITLYLAVQRTVFSELDGDLELEAKEVQNGITFVHGNIIFANLPEWGEPEHGQIEVNPTFLQVTGPGGHVIKKSSNLREIILTADTTLRTKTFLNTTLPNAPIRQLQLPLQTPEGHTIAHILIAMPRAEAENVLGTLRIVLAITFPIVLAAVFAVGRFIAVRSVAPIERVIATAERITYENLDERIALPVHRDELYRLTVTINQLLERLKEALVRERQFTADASHELRTPLSALKGTLEVLIRKPRSAEHYMEKITYCISEVDRMSQLVEQLLLLARLDADAARPSLARTDLAAMITAVVRRLHPILSAKGISVKCLNGTTSLVTADPVMLDTMLGNILTNAIKYSPEGGTIEISTAHDGRTTRLLVRDGGIGIPEEHLSRVFDRFYRADASRASRVQGTGLGLSIVKRLADLQNLDVSVESSAGQGTTVTITFSQ